MGYYALGKFAKARVEDAITLLGVNEVKMAIYALEQLLRLSEEEEKTS